MHKVLDFSFLSEITANVAHTAGSFIAAKKDAAEAKKAK